MSLPSSQCGNQLSRKSAFLILAVLVASYGFVGPRPLISSGRIARAAPAGGPTSPRAAPNRLAPSPSVLLITIDTLRADHVGCYGYKRIATPALDGLAATGVRFEHAYAQAPITLPSHAVILTGTYPMFNGVRDFTSTGLPDNIPTLAEILHRHGYATAAFVSSFALSSMWGLNRGFELYDDDLGVSTRGSKDLMLVERRGDRTVDRLLDWLGRTPRTPFFVWLHLYDPHSPYRPPEPYRGQYASHPYDGEIAFDDAQLGRVFARLRALHLYDNTLIVVLSDHGESLGEHAEGEHGFFIYNATLRIPLIAKFPEASPAGRVIAQPVAAVDVASTIAQVCRAPTEEWRGFQGRSLLGTLGAPPSEQSAAVYAESYYPRDSFGWHELRAVLTAQNAYIDAPRPELYDLARDPAETVNLFAKNPSLAAALRERLVDFETRFTGREASAQGSRLDPETLEKLKSLGYLSYKAEAGGPVVDADRADPKDKIDTLNRILRAADLTRTGKNAEADALLAALEPLEPHLYILPFQKGENDLAWGKPQQAIAEFQKALARNSAFDQAALGLGRAYFSVGEDGQAATAFDLALRLNPRNFLARVLLAKIYWRQNHLDKAESELAEVVRSHPDFGEARADYGILLAMQGSYREALTEIETGVHLGYRDAVAFNYLGVCFAQSGERQKALDAYEQAVQLNPRYPTPLLNLALQYRNHGEAQKAQAYFRRVCDLSKELCGKYAGEFK